jgi:hypothetical protein
LVFGQEAAQGEIVAQLRGIMGEEGAVGVEGMLKSAREPAKGLVATIETPAPQQSSEEPRRRVADSGKNFQNEVVAAPPKGIVIKRLSGVFALEDTGFYEPLR